MTRKTLLAIAAAGFAATAAAQTPFQGSWTIEPARWKSEQAGQAAAGERLYLQMRSDAPDSWSNWGTTVPRAAFSGLPADLTDVRDARFELRHDAGTMAFEGVFRRGRGVGEYRFTPNREYASFTQKRSTKPIDDKMLFRLTMNDVSRAFIQEMERLGYRDLSVDELVKFRIHNIDADLVKDLQADGYKNLTPQDLVDFAIHGRRWFERRRGLRK